VVGFDDSVLESGVRREFGRTAVAIASIGSGKELSIGNHSGQGVNTFRGSVEELVYGEFG